MEQQVESGGKCRGNTTGTFVHDDNIRNLEQDRKVG